MDNVTHTLVGVALAEVALRHKAVPGERRIFMAAGVIAANLPDLDILYTGIAPAPLGYLLHHRGHTHTVVGLVAQALVFGALYAIPALRRRVAGSGARLWLLIAAALASHLVLDSWNSYGVHPFYPMDSRWYYGDAVFIFEPWLWVLLAVPAILNATLRRTSLAVGTLIVALLGLVTWADIVAPMLLVVLATCGLAIAWLSRERTPRVRSATALAATGVFVALIFGTKGFARAQAVAAIDSVPVGELLDVVLTSHPANPLCWEAIAVEKNESGGVYVLRQGTVALAGARCAVAFAGASGGSPGSRGGGIWRGEIRQSLPGFRELAERDCWVASWLGFGRAPVIRGGEILDLRFERTGRDNFTSMGVAAEGTARGCPARLPRWGMPRADLFR